MPWTLVKRFTFEASHRLPFHEGKCARLHGHSWGLQVECRGTLLHAEGSSSGMLLDYADISAAVRPLLEEFLDHWHLNDSTQLESPTSEMLAWWIFAQLKPHLPLLVAVTLEETCTSACTYRP